MRMISMEVIIKEHRNPMSVLPAFRVIKSITAVKSYQIHVGIIVVVTKN